MSVFWIGAATLLVIALGVFIIPVIKVKKARHGASLNVAIAKQQLQEIEREASENLISEKEKLDAEKDVKLALAVEMESKASKFINKSNFNVFQLIVFIGAVAFATFTYLKVGAYSHVEDWIDAQSQLSVLGKRIVVDADSSVTEEDLQTFALALRTKLRDGNDDPVGWLLLGRVLSALNDINGSLAAFEKSYQLDPNRSGLLISYSQVLLLTDQSDNIRKAKALLQQAERERNVLGLLAIATTRLGENDEALVYWRELQSLVPASDPLYANIKDRIRELSSDATTLQVTVRITEQFISQVPKNGVLFVFLQDAGSGAKMPAAVKRMPIGENVNLLEGIELTLDKSAAMMPEFTIENIEQGRLVARISRDNNVEISAGELQGELSIDVVQNSNTAHTIIINKEL